MTFVQPIYTPNFDGIAGVSACYILLTSIDDFLQSTFGGSSDLLIYIIDDDTGELIAASKESVAMTFTTKTYGDYSFEYPFRVLASNSSDSNVVEAEAFLRTGTKLKPGAANRTTFVYEFSDFGLSWIQSATLSEANGFDTVRANWNLNWRIVAIQAIHCTAGSRSDVGPGERSIGACTSCELDGPTFSSHGGAVYTCDCFSEYYMTDKGTCKVRFLACRECPFEGLNP